MKIFIRNTFAAFAATGLLVAGFASCGSDDDDEPKNLIVGGWKQVDIYTGLEVKPEPAVGILQEIEDELKRHKDFPYEGTGWLYKLESDKTMTVHASSWPGLLMTGTYELSDNKLTAFLTRTDLAQVGGPVKHGPYSVAFMGNDDIRLWKCVKADIQKFVDANYPDEGLTVEKSVLEIRLKRHEIDRYEPEPVSSGSPGNSRL